MRIGVKSDEQVQRLRHQWAEIQSQIANAWGLVQSFLSDRDTEEILHKRDVLWGPGRSKTFGRTAQTAMGVKIFSAGPPARPILEEVAMNKSRSETGTA